LKLFFFIAGKNSEDNNSKQAEADKRVESHKWSFSVHRYKIFWVKDFLVRILAA
jgi:hypothetical protein